MGNSDLLHTACYTIQKYALKFSWWLKQLSKIKIVFSKNFPNSIGPLWGICKGVYVLRGVNIGTSTFIFKIFCVGYSVGNK